MPWAGARPILGLGAVLGATTLPSPTQEGNFPQSSDSFWGGFRGKTIVFLMFLPPLKRFFGHSSAPRPCTGVRIGGKSSQQLPAPSYHPQIPEKQQFTTENLEKLN